MQKRHFSLALLLGSMFALFTLLSFHDGDPNVPHKEKAQAAKSNKARPKAPVLRPSQKFYPLISAIWPSLDHQNRGYVSRQDIEVAVYTEHSIKGDHAAALFALRESFDSLAVKGPDGKARVTLSDLRHFSATLPAAQSQSVDEQMLQAQNFFAKVNRSLYPSGPEADSLRKMKYTLHQRHRGNCYFESGCGASAAVDPTGLRSMISDNGIDKRGIHTYSVRFLRVPDEEYVVDDLTDVGLLLNDVDEDSGTWLTVLVRAYGQYQKQHPDVRFLQRWYFGLNTHVLPEDLTDQGSIHSDGLRMTTPRGTRVKQVVWIVEPGVMKNYLGDRFAEGLAQAVKALSSDDANVLRDYLGAHAKEVADLLKMIDPAWLKGPAADTATRIIQKVLQKQLYQKRDPAATHAQLKQSICDEHLPATAFKLGGEHEASIIDYQPGTKSRDGKHTSKYGFVTVRDQAGWRTSGEQEKLRQGIWWQEPGGDDNCVSMSVEEFTAFYSGFASVLK